MKTKANKKLVVISLTVLTSVSSFICHTRETIGNIYNKSNNDILVYLEKPVNMSDRRLFFWEACWLVPCGKKVTMSIPYVPDDPDTSKWCFYYFDADSIGTLKRTSKLPMNYSINNVGRLLLKVDTVRVKEMSDNSIELIYK